MTKKLKAYRVDSGNEDGNSVIVFHTNNASARHKGASQLDSTFEEVESCRRAPEFDQYAPGPVPPTVLIEHGWWQECLHCGTRVTNEDEEWSADEDDYVRLQPVDYGTQIFCTPTCQAKHFAEKRGNAAARTALFELVTAKFPGADVTRIHVYGDRLEQSPPGHGIRASADFRFPGCTGIASYHFGEPHVYVNKADVDTFKSLYGSRES